MEEGIEQILDVDLSPVAEHRGRVFGHDGSIITFRQGILAKKSREREFVFYRNFKGWVHDYMSEDMLPEVRGIGFISEQDETKYKMTIFPTLIPPEISGTPYLILGDIIAGYARPAVLDIKLGTRTWEIGADPNKVERHKIKCANATTNECGFRVRAAMWYSKNPDMWPLREGEYSVVDRKFGTTCTTEEMTEFFKDFFHNTDLIPAFIVKLRRIRTGLEKLRNEGGIRMFSSSALCVYDEADPTKYDCRILDFEKTYFNIENTAARFHESVEDCEDCVVPGVSQLMDKLLLLTSQ